MKVGIFLTIVGGFVTFGWLHTYMYGGDTLSAGLAELLIAVPCLYFGIKRIKKARKQSSEKQ